MFFGSRKSEYLLQMYIDWMIEQSFWGLVYPVMPLHITCILSFAKRM